MKLADIGLIGLAVMGENLVMNMESKGFTVAVYNRTGDKVTNFVEGRAKGKNIIGTYTIEELVSKLEKPRRVMMMVKAGDAVDNLIESLLQHLEPGDIISVMIPEGGHSMLYVGDYLGDGNEYIIHSTGDGSNYITGKDSVHKNGTIRRDKVDILFDESSTSTFSLRRSEAYQFSVVRPANVLKLSDMTPAAKARLKYSLMDVDRSASTSLYTSV